MSHVDIVIQGSAVFAACLDMEADLDQAVKDIFGIFPGVYKVELTKGANIQQVIKKKLPCNSEVLEYSGKQIAAAA